MGPFSASREFQHAFVAMSYFAGSRGAALLEPLPTVLASTRELGVRLAHEDRNERAMALADELAKVVRSLDARSFR